MNLGSDIGFLDGSAAEYDRNRLSHLARPVPALQVQDRVSRSDSLDCQGAEVHNKVQDLT
jgi:hypothetical protein